MEQCKITAIANQKGDVGKTITTFNLGVGLARVGQRVLLVDADPQGSLTISMGIKTPDDLDTTITSLMQATISQLYTFSRFFGSGCRILCTLYKPGPPHFHETAPCLFVGFLRSSGVDRLS